MGNTLSPRSIEKVHCEPMIEPIIEDSRRKTSKYRIYAIYNFMYSGQTIQMKWIFLQNMIEYMDFSSFSELFVYYMAILYLSYQYERLSRQYPLVYGDSLKEMIFMKEYIKNERMDEVQREELERILEEIRMKIIEKTGYKLVNPYFSKINQKILHNIFLENYEFFKRNTIIDGMILENTCYSSLIEMVCWENICYSFS